MNESLLAISAGNERDVFSGGLFLLDAGAMTPVDLLATAGLYRSGREFYRVASQRQHDGAEILVYDDRGIARYVRVDGVPDPHDLTVLDDGTVLCVSPSANAIFAVEPDGAARAVWDARAPFDAWHVNCAVQHGGRLYATAFGRFDRYRGWNANCQQTGILFDVASGEDVIAGLTQPHTPRWIDGGWAVCDSGTGSVLRIGPSGERRQIALGGFTRGLCALGDRVYVGVSELRTTRNFLGTASIAVLDRASWAEIERIPMPGGNPYDIVAVDAATAAALRIGFGFCSRRRRNLDQLAMFEAVGVTPSRLWAIGDPLTPQGCRVRIEAAVPPAMAAGDAVGVPCRVTSHADALLVTAPPYPVYLSYKWLDAAGARAPQTALKTPLPATLPPQASLDVQVVVGAPVLPGRYTLLITAFQEQVQWFDDVDPGSAYRTAVDVVTAAAAS